ncbi:MAG: polysaccharide biosynthesis protein, partial [Vicinamibacterales bacterium]
MMPLTDHEVETILGRPVRRLLTAADRRAFAGRRVLITGAAGSIGSELARQIAACGPARLTLLDQAEHGLFQVE